MTGAGVFFLILFLLLLVYGGWVGWKVYNARKNGDKLVGWKAYVPFTKPTSSSTTNYPTPRSAGPLDWIKDTIDRLRNKRSQTGGFEDARGGVEGQYQNLGGGGGGGSRRGRGVEDDAWDSRVGGRDEDPYGPGPGGYHEEAELGLAPTPGISGHGRNDSDPYGGDYIGQNTSYGGGSRGRSSERGGGSGHLDPFSDANQASSFRGVSPRPDHIDTRPPHKKMDSYDDMAGNTSPISTRKSVFREDVS